MFNNFLFNILLVVLYRYTNFPCLVSLGTHTQYVLYKVYFWMGPQ